jgi:hypothetical protein
MSNQNKQLTPDQREALQTIAKGRKDIVYFAEKMLGINFYDEQRIWMWASTKTNRSACIALAEDIDFDLPEMFQDHDQYFTALYAGIDQHILCTANQIGKTFLTAIKHCWSNYYKIGRNVVGDKFESMEYKTLNVSPHSDQANKCKEYVEMLFMGQVVFYSPEEDMLVSNQVHQAVEGFVSGGNKSIGELTFANGAIFYSKSTGQDKGTARAGEQFGYISYDECAQSRHLKDELPMLQSRVIRYGYSFDLISSPEAGKPSHLYYSRLVKKGMKLDGTWWGFTGIPLDKNKFIPEKQREKAKKRIEDTDPEKAKQMLRGLFISTGEKFISMEVVQQIFDKSVQQLDEGIKGNRYLITADWGMADTGDKTVFYVLDYTEWWTKKKIKIVYEEVIQGGSPTMQFATLRVLFDKFGGHGSKDNEGEWETYPVKLVTDSNSLGGTIIKKMIKELKPYGFGSKGGQKDEMLAISYNLLNYERDFKSHPLEATVIENNPDFGVLRSFYIPELEEQLGIYKIDDTKIEQDRVMSLFMGLYYIKKKLPQQPNAKLDLNMNTNYNNMRSGNLEDLSRVRR